MKKLSFAVYALISAGLIAIGCAGKATDAEVAQMCRHLAELRSEKGGSADVDATEELTKCKADKMLTEVSPKTAACRIAAKDVDTFWNKCR